MRRVWVNCRLIVTCGGLSNTRFLFPIFFYSFLLLALLYHVCLFVGFEIQFTLTGDDVNKKLIVCKYQKGTNGRMCVWYSFACSWILSVYFITSLLRLYAFSSVCVLCVYCAGTNKSNTHSFDILVMWKFLEKRNFFSSFFGFFPFEIKTKKKVMREGLLKGKSMEWREMFKSF